MAQEEGKDWYNYPLYTDPYIRRLHKEVDFVLKKVEKTVYHVDDFSHFDSMHYCTHQWLKEFLDTTFAGRNFKAMEFCSGAGSTSRYITARYPVTITSLDFTEGLNEVHRRINKLCGINTTTVVQGDATNFDTAGFSVDENCDLIFSIQSFLHIENRADLYRMANKVLKVGGKFYFEDFTTQSPIAENEEEIAACNKLRFCSRPITSLNCQLLEAAGFQVENYIQRTREWSEYVYWRAEHALEQKEYIIREHGEEVFVTRYNNAIWNTTKLYHDLGLNLGEVKAKYPLLTAEVGEAFLQQWTQDAPQKYGGSYIVATKVRSVA
jgi:cyclopropane fatty-acyl-phospholipid synthase-like methyltransferase